MHGPLQVKENDLARHRGRYTAGWDEVRRRRFAKQIAEGLFDPGTPIAERNTEPGYDAPLWNALTADEQRRYQRYQEVYAALVDSVDQSVGRLLDLLDDLGEAEDTIVVFTSDNGGTAEGGATGTRSYFSQFVHGPVPSDWERDVPHDEDLIGSADLGVHYPRGWGQASNTPFRFYKGQTFAGGVRVPFVLSWPGGLRRSADDTGVRRQFAYVTDLAPTLLDLAGVATPDTRNGRPALERDGTSVADVLRSAAAESPRVEQYAEFGGHRGFYRDGWKLLSLHDGSPADVDRPRWELYDVLSDPAETRDVAADHPDLVADLAAAWDDAAWHNTVFPLFDSPGAAQRRRPAEESRFASPVRLLAGTPTLERYRSSRLIAYRDFEMEVELRERAPTDDGVLVAHGDQQGGYLLVIEDRALTFTFNSYGRISRTTVPLPDDALTVTLTAKATPQVRWDFTIAVDGDAVASIPDVVQLVGMAPWTGISVGLDARGAVDPDLRLRRGIFRAGSWLIAVTYRPGEIRVPESVRREIDDHAADHAD